LISASIANLKDPTSGATNWSCPTAENTSESAWQQLAASMRAIAAQVKERAPAARLIFVDYPVILPEQGTCSATPLSNEQGDAIRVMAKHLAQVTAAAAREAQVELLPASVLSIGHDACAAEPWMNGFPRPGKKLIGTPYHPNVDGMTAIANALDKLLTR
jgi:hypothetical protein